MEKHISSRQHQILDLLLQNREGLSIDEISKKLNISRNAVQQHFISLEQGQYIETKCLKKTAGRPVRTFVLTDNAINYFPKQYAWFSDLILDDLKQEMGSQVFTQYIQKLGATLSESLSEKFEGKTSDQRISELVKVMNELGYRASFFKKTNAEEPYIEASNCIYHDLAQKHQEICELDKTLISTLLDTEIELVECTAKGGHTCRFNIKQ